MIKIQPEQKKTENPIRQEETLLEYYQVIKLQILDSANHKARNFVKELLIELEEKIVKEIGIIENCGKNFARLNEVDDLLSTKTKEFEGLLESYKILTKGNKTSQNRATSSQRSFLSAKTPEMKLSKEQDMKKLRDEVRFLTEKLTTLTNSAKDLLSKKEREVKKGKDEKKQALALLNFESFYSVLSIFQESAEKQLEVFSKKIAILEKSVETIRKVIRGQFMYKKNSNLITRGLESKLNELKAEIKKKDDGLEIQAKNLEKINKMYILLQDRSKEFIEKYNEIAKKNNEKEEKAKDSEKQIEILLKENEKLNSYKNAFESELNSLKSLFQKDLEHLNKKLESVFTENSVIKQKYDEIKQKYEKVLIEKEEMLNIAFEKKNNTEQLRSENKSTSNSISALKQELKITEAKFESLLKEKNQLKSSQKITIEKLFKEILNYLSDFSIKVLDHINKINSSVYQKINKVNTSITKFSKINKKSLEKIDKPCSQIAKPQHLKEDLIAELKKHENSPNLTTFCLQETPCNHCSRLSKVLKEKDERIFFLQKELYALNSQNSRSYLSFTFNSPQLGAVDSENRRKSSDSKVLSDDDLTYTLELTAIKSTQDANSLLNLSNSSYNHNY